MYVYICMLTYIYLYISIQISVWAHKNLPTCLILSLYFKMVAMRLFSLSGLSFLSNLTFFKAGVVVSARNNSANVSFRGSKYKRCSNKRRD